MGNSTLIIDISTFFVSVGVSTFLAGTRWGRVESSIRDLETRLAKIEGMFQLKLRE